MKGKEGFSKFINAKPSNASVKEKLRQEKKAMVKAKRDAIEKHFEEVKNNKIYEVDELYKDIGTDKKTVSQKLEKMKPASRVMKQN